MRVSSALTPVTFPVERSKVLFRIAPPFTLGLLVIDLPPFVATFSVGRLVEFVPEIVFAIKVRVLPFDLTSFLPCVLFFGFSCHGQRLLGFDLV